MPINLPVTEICDLGCQTAATEILREMSKIVLTSDYQTHHLGSYFADNNVANKGSLVNGVDYTQSITLDDLTFPNNTVISWSWPDAPPSAYAPSTVYSDPGIIYGSSPWSSGPGPVSAQLANLSNLAANYSLAITGDPKNVDVIFDLWLTSTANGGVSAIQDEVVVWLHSPPRTAAPTSLTFSDSTYSAPVYVTYSGIGTQIIQAIPTTDHLGGTISISDIIKSLIWNGVVTGNEYVSGVNLDAEPRAGTGSLIVNSLSYQWQANPTTTIDASNSLSLAGIGGNHVLGNGGLDTVIYSGNYAQYQTKQSGSELLVLQNGNGWNVDMLQGIAAVEFSDGTYNVAQNVFVPSSTDPVITQISASLTQGLEVAGGALKITLSLSKAVVVSGGTPTLALNDGGIAVYNANESAALGDPTKLVFDYTVAAGQNTAVLAVTAFAVNGAAIVDQAGNPADLSTAASNLGGEIIVAANGVVTLNLAQARAIETGALAVTLPVGEAVTVIDSFAKIKQLSAGQIAGLGLLGVKSIVATDQVAALSSTQEIAIGKAAITFTEPYGAGSTQTFTWNADGSLHEFACNGISGQKWTSTDTVYGSTSTTETWNNGTALVQSETWNADGTRDIHSYGIMGQAWTNFDQVYAANGSLLENHYYGITGQAYTDYEVVYGANGKAASATYSNGMTETWTYNADGSLNEVAYNGITGQKWTSTDLLYGSGTETWKNGAVLVQSETWRADGTRDIHFYGITGQAWTDFDQVYAANGTVYENHYYGITGQAYTNFDVVYGTNGKPAIETWYNGGALVKSETWNADGTVSGIQVYPITPNAPTINSFSPLSTAVTGTLGLQVSADHYLGDPLFQVFLDGYQIGGTQSIQAVHTYGQWQEITLTGSFDPNAVHQIVIKFINDAWSGAGRDRNMYVGSVSIGSHVIDGARTTRNTASLGSVDPNSADMFVNGSAVYDISAAQPSTAGTLSPSGGITDANHLTLAGTAEANSTVKVFDGLALLGSAQVNTAGAWTFTTGLLADGAHSFATTDTNAAGTTSTASSAVSVTVDTIAPSPAIANIVQNSNNSATLGGTSEANSTISIYDGTGSTPIGTAVTSNTGTWSFTSGVLSNTVHSLTVHATDVAGNTGYGSGPAVFGTAAGQTLTGGPNALLEGLGAGDTFLLAPNFGNDTLAGFTSHISGPDHDTLSLPAVAFNNNFTQVLAATTFTNTGAVITVDARDTIEIPGLTQALMVANSGSFSFHT